MTLAHPTILQLRCSRTPALLFDPGAVVKKAEGLADCMRWSLTLLAFLMASTGVR